MARRQFASENIWKDSSSRLWRQCVTAAGGRCYALVVTIRVLSESLGGRSYSNRLFSFSQCFSHACHEIRASA
jgi:hypothetical protein